MNTSSDRQMPVPLRLRPLRGHRLDRCCLHFPEGQPGAQTQRDRAPGPEPRPPASNPASYKPLLPWPVGPPSVPSSDTGDTGWERAGQPPWAKHYVKSPGAGLSLLSPSRERPGAQTRSQMSAPPSCILKAVPANPKCPLDYPKPPPQPTDMFMLSHCSL